MKIRKFKIFWKIIKNKKKNFKISGNYKKIPKFLKTYENILNCLPYYLKTFEIQLNFLLNYKKI